MEDQVKRKIALVHVAHVAPHDVIVPVSTCTLTTVQHQEEYA